MGMDDWVRVRLGRVGGQLVATPLPRGAGVLTSLVRADGLLVVPAELEGHHAGEEVSVRLLRGVGEIERTIVATGSHDLVLDLAASALRERDPRLTLASSNVGSLGGLTALRDGLCHVAGSHLLDPESGEYTLPYVDRLLPGREVSVVRLVHREQGLIVAPGNPTGTDEHRGRGRTGASLRQSSARGGHAGAPGSRAVAARHLRRGDRGLRARGAHPPRGCRGGGGRPGGLRTGRSGCGTSVRPRLRAGRTGAIRPRLRARPDPLSALDPARIGRTSAAPSRTWAATTPPRWAARFADPPPPASWASVRARLAVGGRWRMPGPSRLVVRPARRAREPGRCPR